ncbi:hypothetical protein FGO68_gene533 [Halteria grandinella]|uniref:Uncharacterized protein n=1 Tax=Halteria grandinella TaxID=5974 RepID=A0A8J8NW83_HALGN|nr:hypothetical protein FGO68_gene533 [Halteria grandinella]
MQNLFNLNDMGDAAESFTRILEILHVSQTQHKGEGQPIDGPATFIDFGESCSKNGKKCMFHRIFWINQLSQRKCRCGLACSVEQSDLNNYSIVVNMDQFLQTLRAYTKYLIQNDVFTEDIEEVKMSFIDVLQMSFTAEEQFCKNEACTIKKSRMMYKIDLKEGVPQVMTFNLNWIDENVPKQNISSLLDTIQSKFALCDLYETDDLPVLEFKKINYMLQGFVAYYGRHYSCFFQGIINGNKVWQEYNDAMAKEYKSFEEVISFCKKCGIKPTLMFYQLASQSADTDTLFSIRLSQYRAQLPDYRIRLAVNADYKPYDGQEAYFPSYGEISMPRALQVELRANQETKDVYIYKCLHCGKYTLLHYKMCHYCEKYNECYETSASVSRIGYQKEDEILQKLEKAMYQQELSNSQKQMLDDEWYQNPVHYSPWHSMPGLRMHQHQHQHQHQHHYQPQSQSRLFFVMQPPGYYYPK